ncbi:predicted protein [Postia placenta Mad-698-R]|nr:predicted protein [Postia placenta Mad-698-R]
MHEDTSQDPEKSPLDKPCQSWGIGESCDQIKAVKAFLLAAGCVICGDNLQPQENGNKACIWARRAINRKCADSGRTRTHARYRYGILKSGTETDQDGARPKAGDVQTPAITIEVGTKLVEAFKEPRLQGEATTQESIRHMV